MSTNLKILSGGREGAAVSRPLSDKNELMHLRNVNGALLQDALDTWGELWDQFQGSLTNGVMIVPEAEKNFEPKCGWPEFLEKMWLLRHYIDHAKRICDDKA